MIIEQLFPNIVAEKSILGDCFIEEARLRNIDPEYVNAIISIIPKALIHAPCFLDRMTNIWRYEFGIPYDIKEKLVWGTHMWVPVACLFDATSCAYSRLSEDVRSIYLDKLANPRKHQTVLVEMIPGFKVDTKMSVQFEVAGLGVGNSTVDWVIQPQDDRMVLIDVKRRIMDFIKQAELMDGKSADPEPNHDPELLFRSIEHKFNPNNPDQQLQGAWIVTDIKQNEKRLSEAFTALDARKIHFAIFGDWKSDAYILAQRDIDEQYLRKIFNVEPSTRFTFTNEKG